MYKTKNKRKNATAMGFTLIELMIVIIIMGVLASVALLAFQTYINKARSAEAAGLLANIKGQQESYRSEFGMYCDVAVDGLGDPPDAPEPDGTDWDSDDVDDGWLQLGFRPDNRAIYFAVNTIAGAPGDGNTHGWVGAAGVELPTDSPEEFTQDHWFIARALGDQDTDGTYSVFWITHMTTGVDSKSPAE